MSDFFSNVPPRQKESWRMVGDPGQPAFLNGWTNLGFNQPGLGFKMRIDATGERVVDVQGTLNGSAATSATIFNLPPKYAVPPGVATNLIGSRSADFTTFTFQFAGPFGDTFALLTPQTTPILAVIVNGFYYLDPPRLIP